MKVIDNVRIYDPQREFKKDVAFHLVIEDGAFQTINEGRFKGQADEYVDGNKRVLCPSFTDSHLHLLRYGLMKRELDLRAFESWAEVKKAIADEQNKPHIKEDEWIVARGLMDNQYDDIPRLAVASDLDEIDNEHPLFILHKDGHECVVNTRALEKIEQNEDLSADHDQFIEKDNNGKWTGRFKDTAVHFIKFHFREKNVPEIINALESALPYLAKYGITSVHPDDLNYAGNYGMVWKCYRRLEKEGKLSVRAFLHHYVFNIDDMHYYLQNSDKRTGDGTDKVRVGAFKIFVDGTHRLHTAALEEPYHDDPKTRGTLLYKQDELNEMLRLAEENNMQVAMHCIGDRAVKTALNAIAQTENSMRHRIIHADTLSDALLQRLREVKPCIESQPGFLLDEWNNYAKWLGEKRGPYCGMAKSVIDTGSPVSLSSDAPIGPLNPFEHIFAAVNRTDREGHPKGGWIPSEKLDFETAFKGYTAVPPYLEFAEDMKGTIKPGAKADFMLLEDYPTDCPTETLNEIKVQQTWMDGNKVYDRAFE